MKIKKLFSVMFFLLLFVIAFMPTSGHFARAQSFVQKPLPSFSLRLSDSNFATINKECITFDSNLYSSESVFSKIPLSMEYEIKNGESASTVDFILPLCSRPHELPTLSITAGSETLPYKISYGKPYFDSGDYENLIEDALAPPIPLNDFGVLYTIDTIPGQPLSVELSYSGSKAIFHSGYNQSTQRNGYKSFTLENPQSNYYLLFVSNGGVDSIHTSSTYKKQALSYQEYFDRIYEHLLEYDFLQAPIDFYLSLFTNAIADYRICTIYELLDQDTSPYISVAKFSRPFDANETISIRIETQAEVVANPDFEPYINMLQFFTDKNKSHAFEFNFFTSPNFPHIIESPLSLIKTANGYTFISQSVPGNYYIVFSSSKSPISKFDKPTYTNNNTIIFIILGVALAGVLTFFITWFAIKSKKNFD